MTQTDTVRSQLPALLPRLRRFARAIARNPQDADDIVQIAVERALVRSEQWNAEQKLESWMFGIVRNAWIDEVRSRQRRGQLFVPEELGENVGNDVIETQTTLLSVQEAMAQLPEEQRSAVALVLVEGLSYKEASQAMDIPIGTLTSRLARGRATLQTLLGNESGAMP